MSQMAEEGTPQLVWIRAGRWDWFSECCKFTIHRFVVGEHELLGTGFPWPDRYRVRQRTTRGYEDIANEPTLDAAKRVCEENLK